MSDQDFRERVLSALDRLERKHEQLDKKFDQKFESMKTRMGLLEQGVSWTRGKIEGQTEASVTLVSRVAIGISIVSTVIALFALLK